MGSSKNNIRFANEEMERSGAEELGEPTSMEPEVGRAPAGPLQKDPVAILVSFGSGSCFCWILLLPAIASLHGNGTWGEGRILGGKGSQGLAQSVL